VDNRGKFKEAVSPGMGTEPVGVELVVPPSEERVFPASWGRGTLDIVIP
jgi:hypothetical protein